MCIEVDGQKLDDTGRLKILREIEEESKFVPSQFERGSIADIVSEGMKIAKKDGEFIGFHRAIFKAATRVTYKAAGQSAEVRAVLMSLYADILELKP